MTTTLSGHIEIDDAGVARIAGSRVKVIHLVMEKQTNNWSPEELQQNFPHLPIAAVYAAMTYYHDHQAECDAQIDAGLRLAEQEQSSTPEGPFVRRMRSEGKLP
ncbi:MAG TPA: DUF433 domain-containing protein [Tepidisphaeraceae bacterium]|jgi:uncharacterized protein (DUF433 family)|nr:DUF433 domain-containing protein [Tepidisphaeraceae bacterium]